MFNGPNVDAALVERATQRGPVILIEDDAALRGALYRALTQWGFSVIAHESGRTVVSAVQSHRAAIVITDIYMPDTDGIEVVRSLRRECPGTPVIAMSGDASVGSGRNGMLGVAEALGAAAVLAKPFSLDELKAVLVSMLAPT